MKNRVLLFLQLLGVVMQPLFAAKEYEVRDSVLIIPSSVTELKAREFAGRTDFNRVKFEWGSKLERIGDAAFERCENLQSIKLPSRIRVIPWGCFAWCRSLSEVTMPNELFDIGSQAFAYCESLGEIRLPKKLRHIGSNAFAFCTSLTEIEIPAAVTELESYAFAECHSLKKAVLPPNRRMLGELIFAGCRNLEEIEEFSPMPPKFECESTLFDSYEEFMYFKCKLIVNANNYSAYKVAPGWRKFKNIVKERRGVKPSEFRRS